MKTHNYWCESGRWGAARQGQHLKKKKKKIVIDRDVIERVMVDSGGGREGEGVGGAGG